MHAYLSLEVKGHHGETEVKQEVLLLDALQGPAHTECHHVWPCDEQCGAEHQENAQTHDAHKTDLGPKQITAADDSVLKFSHTAAQVTCNVRLLRNCYALRFICSLCY